jgi:hypothetical protein
MSKKLDGLVRLVQRLNIPYSQTRLQPNAESTESHEAAKTSRPTQSANPDQEGIDTSLLVNALQVASFLETALDHQATAGIRSSRQTLQAVLDSQGRHSSFSEGPPFASFLLPGTTLRDLPMPPIEKIMACLRMVQDRGITTAPWLGEVKSFGDFTLILIQVCSPGSVSDAELIISLFGLYWLFTVCTRWASSKTRQDLKEHARICQSSLEVVLSSLNFWVPMTIDAVLAMDLAPP